MSPLVIGLLGLGALFMLVALHVSLAFAMIVVGVSAFALQTSWEPALTFLATDPAQVLGSLDLAVIPMFLLMGTLVSLAGFSRDLYTAAAALLGHRVGGLSYATIGGSAAFGAICGSSPATVATFTRIALPEMLKRDYEPGFAGATIAAGGALKALIPPSLSMILYAVVAQVYIFDIFIAAIIPAAITIAANALAVLFILRRNPALAPASPRIGSAERYQAIWRALPATFLILLVFVGLYSGIFTVNEAAAVAVVVAFIFALLRRSLTVDRLMQAFRETAVVAGMIYFVLIGSAVFTYFISLARIPELLISGVAAIDLPATAVIAIMLLVYLLLGAVFDELAAMIVTLPFALPLIVHLGYDPVWWGIVNVVIVELGLIIPPIGMVILIIHGMRPDLPLRMLYRAISGFIIADLVVLGMLVAFPQIALWLPSILR